MYIKDKSDQRVYAIAGPYNEDDSIDLMCIAENGKRPSLLEVLLINLNYLLSLKEGVKTLTDFFSLNTHTQLSHESNELLIH